MKKRGLSISIVVFLVLILLTTVYGYGVSPVGIIEDNLLRGQVIEQKIHLSTGGNPVHVTIELKDDYMKPWIETNKGFSFDVTSSAPSFPVDFTITIPEDAPLGMHQTDFRIILSPSHKAQEEGMGTAVNYASLIDVKLTVTDEEVKNYEIKEITLNDIEEDNPLYVKVEVINKGNVMLMPFEMSLTILDMDGKEVFIGKPVSEDIIQSGERESFLYEADAGLKVGNYKAIVKLFDDSKLIKGEELFFNVLIQGDKVKKGTLLTFNAPDTATLREKVKLVAVFKNDWKTNIVGKSVVEVYSGTKLLEVVESNPMDIDPEDTAQFISYYDADDSGLLTLKAHIYFEGKNSNIIEKSMNVISMEPSKFPITSIAFVMIIVILIAVIAYLLGQRRAIDKKRK